MRNQGLLLGTHDLIGMTKHVATFIGRYSFKVLLHVQPAFYSVGDLARGFGCGGHCGYQAALSVLSDGSVSICSLGKRAPEYIFGDVATIELERVWTTHPLLEQVHDGGHHLLKGICARCVFRRFCAGGCRAVALDYYGDFFAPFPMCQELFESGGFPATFIRPATPAEGDGSYTSAKCVARV
jgi:radical SAM protein with 4Fe4S-binding SPASM domain